LSLIDGDDANVAVFDAEVVPPALAEIEA